MKWRNVSFYLATANKVALQLPNDVRVTHNISRNVYPFHNISWNVYLFNNICRNVYLFSSKIKIPVRRWTASDALGAGGGIHRIHYTRRCWMREDYFLQILYLLSSPFFNSNIISIITACLTFFYYLNQWSSRVGDLEYENGN